MALGMEALKRRLSESRLHVALLALLFLWPRSRPNVYVVPVGPALDGQLGVPDELNRSKMTCKVKTLRFFPLHRPPGPTHLVVLVDIGAE